MKNYKARILVGSSFAYRNCKAETIEAAIEHFKATLGDDEALIQVKGGHQDGESFMPEVSKEMQEEG